MREFLNGFIYHEKCVKYYAHKTFSFPVYDAFVRINRVWSFPSYFISFVNWECSCVRWCLVATQLKQNKTHQPITATICQICIWMSIRMCMCVSVSVNRLALAATCTVDDVFITICFLLSLSLSLWMQCMNGNLKCTHDQPNTKQKRIEKKQQLTWLNGMMLMMMMSSNSSPNKSR